MEGDKGMNLLQMGRSPREQGQRARRRKRGNKYNKGRHVQEPITSMNVNIICHKHELRLINSNKNENEESGIKRGRREWEGRSFKKKKLVLHSFTHSPR